MFCMIVTKRYSKLTVCYMLWTLSDIVDVSNMFET